MTDLEIKFIFLWRRRNYFACLFSLISAVLNFSIMKKLSEVFAILFIPAVSENKCFGEIQNGIMEIFGLRGGLGESESPNNKP